MYRGFDMKGFSDFQDFGKDGMNSAVAGFAAWTKGWQSIASECADFTKDAFEKSAKAFEGTVSAKSLESALEVQADYAKQAYEAYMAQAGKISEMYMSVARDAFSPAEKKARRAS